MSQTARLFIARHGQNEDNTNGVLNGYHELLRPCRFIINVNDLPEPIVVPEIIERDFGMIIRRLDGYIEEMCSPDIIKTDTITYFLNPDDVETFDGAYRKVGTI